MELDQQKPSFIRQAVTIGLIFAAVLFFLEILTGLMVIYSSPSAGMLVLSMFSGAVGCLVAAFAGMFGTRMYVREFAVPMTFGDGAKLGLVTGLVVAFGNTFLDVLWLTINPGFQENLLEASIENIEAMQIPEEQKDQMIDALYTETQDAGSASAIGINLVGQVFIFGILNTLTGMLGVRFFATQPGQEQEQI